MSKAFTKQTIETSSPFWKRIKNFFAIDPQRSSGLTFNDKYRNPPPGSRTEIYKEPVTAPANDIAFNPYFARDVRRAYPRTVTFTQKTVAGLLTYGNAASPAIADGNAGQTALAKIGELELAQVLTGEVEAKRVLVDGMPPLPMGRKGREWVLDQDQSEGFPQENWNREVAVALGFC